MLQTRQIQNLLASCDLAQTSQGGKISVNLAVCSAKIGKTAAQPLNISRKPLGLHPWGV